VVLWTFVLVIGLFLVSSVDMVENIAVVAVSVVAATRVLAYVREKAAHELAKAIPLAMLLLLLTGGAVQLEEKVDRLDERPDTGFTDEMFWFLIALEIGLRLTTELIALARRVLRDRRAPVVHGAAGLG
jgi:hypothetical protein